MSVFENRVRRANGYDLDKILSVVDEEYAKENELEVLKKTGFAPSSIAYGSGRCSRRWVMAFQGEHEARNTFGKNGKSMMGVGEVLHEDIQKMYEDSDLDVEIEVPLENESPPMRGYVDMVITDDSGTKIVVEIKSTGSKSFNAKVGKRKASPNHMYQLLSYMKIMGLEHGLFIYQNRDDMSFMQIPIYMDAKNKDAIDTAFEWMKMVYQKYEDGIMPMRHFSQTSINCKGCPFLESCWELPEGTEKIKSMPLKV